MDKQLIEIIAKSPEAAKVAEKYIDYMYYVVTVKLVAASIFLTIFLIVGYKLIKKFWVDTDDD